MKIMITHLCVHAYVCLCVCLCVRAYSTLVRTERGAHLLAVSVHANWKETVA